MAGTDFEKIPRLQYISQGETPQKHLRNILRMSEAGVPLIQLRLKGLDDVQLRFWAENAKSICDHNGTLLLINDAPEVAASLNAWGVHLGLKDMPITEARKLMGSAIIGGTANSVRDIERRKEEGADYIGLGPFRFTMTKEGLSPVLGLEGLRECMPSAGDIPVIAVGGITEEDVEEILSTGVHGVAISGALTTAEDPKAMVENILKTLNEHQDLAHA